MTIRVALDVTPQLLPRTGVGVFTDEVLHRLAALDEVELSVFAISWEGRERLPGLMPPGATVARRPMAARPPRVAWSRVDWPPIEWWTGPIDVVHGPNFVVPPARHGAEVVTVHDLTPLNHPEMCTDDVLAFPNLVRRAVGRGATVHAVSAWVADEVVELLDVPPDQVVTIPNGLTPLPAADPSKGRDLAGGDRYLVAVGTVEPRKDYPSLVRAFDRVASVDPDVRLVIAGQRGWGAEELDEAVAAASFRDRIVRTGWVDDVGRAALVRGATALVYPSRYEGFGLPPLEAMSVGTPVVCTAAGALPDTVGDGALIVPPSDPELLAQAIEEVLAGGETVERLVERGRARASGFSWDQTIDALVTLYQKLAS